MYKEIESNILKTWVILVLFPLLIVGLAYVFSYRYPVVLPVAIVLAVAQAWVGYYYSDKITLAISRARQIRKSDHPELFRVVENMSIAAGIPMPKVYIIEDTAPNAFATGRDPKHSALAVTTGLLSKLEKVELEGVVAHEIAHIKNYDIRLMTVIVVMVGIVALMADFFLRMSFWGGGDDDRDSGQLGLVMAIAGFVLALLSPLIATLIQLALSRKREYLADASGALLSRYPEGLARALEKISKDTEPLEVANKATAHLYIANPLKDHGGARSWFSGLFDTHPPAEERIKKLRSMA